MRRLVSSERWTSVLLTAMGLAPFGACGGVSIDPGGSAGAPSGGSAGALTGGSGGTGGIVQTGGTGGIVQTGGTGGIAQTGGTGGIAQTGGTGGIVQTGGTGGDVGSGGDAGSGGAGGAPACDGGFGAASGSGCSGGSSGAGGNINPHPCDNPTADEYGVVHCGAGYLHRPQPEKCVSQLPRPTPVPGPVGVDAGYYLSTCRSDADCTAQPHGFCSYMGNAFGPSCSYGCVRDEECGTAQVCSCRSPVGMCVPATCTVDADCGSTFCASYTANLGCSGGIGYACQSARDECMTDKDCPTSMCGFVQLPTPHRACAPRCVQGRPFLVGGEERTAVTIGRAGWAALVAPRVAPLQPLERELLAEAWAQIGLMEHASIAAFARFTMQLMSVGAPAELVAASVAAMRDETTHTQLAFGLATAYAGAPRGPGALDITGSLAANDLHSIVVMTIQEGCIGETVAAMEAAEAALHVQDPAVGVILNTIAADETRHAELAWRFVHWALSRGDDALRETVRATFASALAVAPSAPSSRDGRHDDALLAGGILSPELSAEVRSAALRDVVQVCADEMLASPAARAA